MKKISPIVFSMSLIVAGAGMAAAQDAASTPPKVLQITREWVKPGKTGAIHDKSETAFVAASNRGKLQGHYVALNSMTGKARALYLFRYPSFDAMEQDQKIINKSAALTADFDRAAANDGDLLDGIHGQGADGVDRQEVALGAVARRRDDHLQGGGFGCHVSSLSSAGGGGDRSPSKVRAALCHACGNPARVAEQR